MKSKTARKPKIEAHPTKWQVVIDRGERTGVRLFESKAEADNVANALNFAAGKMVAFVNPPVAAWAGRAP